MIEITNYAEVLRDQAGVSQSIHDLMARFQGDVEKLVDARLVTTDTYVHDSIVMEVIPREQIIPNDVILRGCQS